MSGFEKILADPVYTLILLAILAIVLLGTLALVLPRVEVRSLRELYRLFLGVKVPPMFVALARRSVTFLVGAIIFAVGPAVGLDEFKDRTVATTAAATLVEFAWGLLDQLVKRDQNAKDPPPVAGGAPPGTGQ